MLRTPTPSAHVCERTLPIAVGAAFVAMALMTFLAPHASAAPAVPVFSPAVQVDRLPAYTAGAPSLAVGSNGVVYMAFAGYGGSTTGSDIFFTKSFDGRTWTTPVKVNNDAGGASQSDPSLTLDTMNTIYIAWTDARNGNNDIFFAKSPDGGLSFSANVRVNDVTTNAQTEPDVAVDPANPDLVHVVWTDTRSAILGPDIYYANSTDGGLSFNPSLRVNNDATGAEQGQPAITVGPGREVYVVWSDPRTGGRGRDIYFSRSTDRGATWDPSFPLNDDATGTAQQEPTIAVDAAGTIYVAWSDYRTPNTAPDIYATRSTNSGVSFAANVKVNGDTGVAVQAVPSLAANAGTIEIAWADTRTAGSTSFDIYASSSTDGLTWSSSVKVNDDSLYGVFQYWPSIGVDSAGDVFAAWFDTRASGQDVFASVLDVVSPSANAGSAIAVDRGVAATFDGSGSSDNLGIASYAWDFADGTGGGGATPSHAYAEAGTYDAVLTVWDYSGNAATSSVTVTVRDTERPVARGGGDRSGIEGEPLFFDASASTDNIGIVSYAWTFGDGSTANGATASHIYSQPGTYSATLTVTDAAGNAATTSFSVSVRSDPLLGLIQTLEGVVAILAIALALLAWMVFRRRKPETPSQSGSMPVSRPPPPPPQPPKDSDPLDMTLPPPKVP